MKINGSLGIIFPLIFSGMLIGFGFKSFGIFIFGIVVLIIIIQFILFSINVIKKKIKQNKI